MRPCVELYFLDAGMRYGPELARMSMAGLPQAFYARMLRLPEDEMLTDTPGGVAGELYAKSSGPYWHGKLRRAVRPGDCFTLAGRTWMFIPAQDEALFEHSAAERVGGWPNLHLKIANIRAFATEQKHDQFDGNDVHICGDPV